MTPKKSPKLQVLFSDEERRLLKDSAAKDGREEGPQVKWLVREYGAGRLMPLADHKAKLFDLEGFVNQMADRLYKQIDDLTRRLEVQAEKSSAEIVGMHGTLESPHQLDAGAGKASQLNKDASKKRHRPAAK